MLLLCLMWWCAAVRANVILSWKTCRGTLWRRNWRSRTSFPFLVDEEALAFPTVDVTCGTSTLPT